ncbi:hypothetical protein BpHYR1_046079 [Brachionus plicatilis]|uniref:Uncharacterized protein n=1 Tax=Brachionus plicatilis TaxID=10195 RepID=A0A3M7PZF1_BRAPC|nr:hypothetical protein BpHYR1_046079 [Brachionus plicatilis]
MLVVCIHLKKNSDLKKPIAFLVLKIKYRKIIQKNLSFLSEVNKELCLFDLYVYYQKIYKIVIKLFIVMKSNMVIRRNIQIKEVSNEFSFK